MTLRLFLTGHGGWFANNGYTKVPKGCSFSTPIKFGKLMSNSDVRKFISGKWKRPHESKVEQFKTIPNFTWKNVTSAERKRDLLEFEKYRTNSALTSNNATACYYKSLAPKMQPAQFANIATRRGPGAKGETLNELYKPGFIHSGDSMILIPDNDGSGNASALMSCPKNTTITLDTVFKEINSILQLGISQFGHVEIMWVCCQQLDLNRTCRVQRITNQIENEQGYMHEHDFDLQKKLIMEKQLKIDFIKHKGNNALLHLAAQQAQVEQLANMPKTVSNIKKMLYMNGLNL